MKELKLMRKAGLHTVDSAPLFRCGYFVYAYDMEQWVAMCRILGVDDAVDVGCPGVCQKFVRNTQQVYAIGVFDGGLDTLVHECAHAAFHFCDEIGITVSPDRANETYCYLLDWLFGQGVMGNRAAFRSCLEEPGGE
ncbi:hypothetical protein H5R21_02115 [Escherichia coli]|nr:hypothetical protein [Escherichia coli]